MLQSTNYVDRRFNMIAAKFSQVGYSTSQIGKVSAPPSALPAGFPRVVSADRTVAVAHGRRRAMDDSTRPGIRCEWFISPSHPRLLPFASLPSACSEIASEHCHILDYQPHLLPHILGTLLTSS